MDAPTLRQLANGLGRAAGLITQQAFDAGAELGDLQQDLMVLNAATSICRRAARYIEAKAAQEDPKAPLCLGCKHRAETAGGLGCTEGLDTQEACTRRACRAYKTV